MEFDGFDDFIGMSWRWGLLGGVGVLFLFLDSYPLFGVLVIGRVYFFLYFPPSLLISLRKFFLYQHSAVLWPRLSHMQRHLDILIVLFVHLWFSDLIWTLMHHFVEYIVFGVLVLPFVLCPQMAFLFLLLPGVFC